MKIATGCFILLLITSPDVSSAGVCKWVDEQGVVHFSDRCPENEAAVEMELAEPPTAAEREEAEAIYREVIEQSRSRTAGDNRKPAADAVTRDQPSFHVTPERQRCFKAHLAVQTLEQRGDVYKDASGNFHHWGSFHSFWYEGFRKQVTDRERRDFIEQYEDEMKHYCDMPRREFRKRAEAWDKEYTRSFCPMARAKLDGIRADSGKTPRGEIERIEELISENCDG